MAAYQCVPLSVLILFPLCIMRDMSSLRFVSMASIAALLYTSVVLIIEMPSYYQHFKTIARADPIYIDFNLFTGASMVFFSYMC